jgi:hypothetical protein
MRSPLPKRHGAPVGLKSNGLKSSSLKSSGLKNGKDQVGNIDSLKTA